MNEEKIDLLLQHTITLMEDVKRLGIRMDHLEAEVAAIKTEVAAIKTEVAAIKTEVVTIKTEVAAIKTEVVTIKADVEAVKITVDETKQRLAGIELVLENETNPNIQIIAEGHLDLFRKLDESLKISRESEIYQIKVNRLDSEIRRIKEYYKNQSVNQRAAAN